MKEKVKRLLEKIKLFFNIEKNLKIKIINAGYGTPIKLIRKSYFSYSSCPSNLPSEYCSKDSFIETRVFLTDLGLKVEVKELHEGLNFEAPCDRYKCTINIVN